MCMSVEKVGFSAEQCDKCIWSVLVQALVVVPCCTKLFLKTSQMRSHSDVVLYLGNHSVRHYTSEFKQFGDCVARKLAVRVWSEQLCFRDTLLRDGVFRR